MIKDMGTLLQAFSKHHHNHPLHLGQCYRKFLLLLTKRHQEALAFVYIKNDILFLALKHPGFKMEFELASNKKLFLELWKMLDAPCVKHTPSSVKAFYSKYYAKIKEAQMQSKVYYQERAVGDFKIAAEDAQIKEHFERIKGLIRKQHD